VSFFYRHIRDKNVYEIYQMYDPNFKQLSGRFFPNVPWPAVDAIAPLVDQDHVFCLLYREMYFRDLFARGLQPTLQHRCESWESYCSLFQVQAHSSTGGRQGGVGRGFYSLPPCKVATSSRLSQL